MAKKKHTDGLKRGDVIKERYEVLRLIGEGGMSRVFLAADLKLQNKQWAIKEVDRRAKDPVGRPIEQSLASEADLLSKLDHPNIVNIADIEKTENYIYVVMDHVEGQSLDKVVRENGPQSEEDVKNWMVQVCDALDYLHSQTPPVIYRDMKPSNIMLRPDGNVKLIDLGVAREYKDEAKKDTIAFGTEGYAAPEQYGSVQTDPRTDVYGLGATMWHLLGGAAPPKEYPLRNVRELNPKVAEGFAQVIIPKCTELDREKRYQSCAEMITDLEVYEELTQDYRNEQKSKVRKFGIAAGLAVFFLILGIILTIARTAYINANYDSLISQADVMKRQDPDAATEQYLAALYYKPDAVDAYLGLIYCYRFDGKFTPEEKQQFDAIYNSNKSTLQNSSRFGELSYEIGRLYWYYYTYGSSDGGTDDNQSTRIKASTEYFADAKDAPDFDRRSTAQTYYSIATFTSDIENAIREGEESENLYKDYWNSLVSLTANVESESVEIIKLDSYELVTNGVETYMSKFKDFAKVSRDDQKDLCKQVAEDLQKTNWAETNKMKAQDTRARLEATIIPRIDAVYGSASVAPGTSN